MNLFRKKIEPRCAYCERGSDLGNGKVACVSKGVVDDTYHCRKFRYDPLKRTPPRPAVLKGDGFSPEDFALD